MQSEIIEPMPELRLIFVRAQDDPPLFGHEYQKELADFAASLRVEGIHSSSRAFSRDAVDGGGGLSGEFIFIVSTLGPVAIIQLRKLAEAFLKNREGRRLKVKYGTLTIEGRAEDVEKLVSPEQITKLLEPPKKSVKKRGPDGHE